jgi:hypothetical protein
VGKAVEFGFYFSREKGPELEQKLSRIGKPLFATYLDNGDVVSMVTRVVDFDSKTLPSPKKLKGAGMTLLNTLQEPGASLANCTAILWNDPATIGMLQAIESGGVTITRDVIEKEP